MAHPSSQTDIDHRYMAAAIRLARSHQGQTGTNPSVACILVRHEKVVSRIVGTGITALGGRPHAEPVALAEAGEQARGAVAYVTLEPCAHHGSTPPCADALVVAGIGRVVTAVVDPDDRVSGKGHRILETAGIKTSQGILGINAARPIEGYLTKKNTGKPFVTLKLAITSDGHLGVRGSGMAPITGAVAQKQVHLMRARHDAILVGSGTLLADNPQLTCRLPGMEPRSPMRIVLDSRGTTPPDAKMVETAHATPTMIASPNTVEAHWKASMADAGCQVISCDLDEGRIALPELLEDLALRGVSSLMVEGGATVARSFLDQGLVDAIELFVGAGQVEGDPDAMIKSPVTIEKLPAGFRQVRNSEFMNAEGTDCQYRFEKVQ